MIVKNVDHVDPLDISSSSGGPLVHLWCIHREYSSAEVVNFYGLLSPDERVRADNLKSSEAKSNFIISRALLRLVLAKYISKSDPGSLIFQYGVHGKPGLQGFPSLSFNLSHSGNRLLVAVAQDFVVGVDVEIMRARSNIVKFADRFFAVSEAESVKQLAKQAQTRRFYELWVAKESILKAEGVGVSPLALRKLVVDEVVGFEVSCWVDGGYCCGLASSAKDVSVEMINVRVSDFRF